MLNRRTLLTLALCAIAISACKKEAEADPVVSPEAAPPSLVNPAVLPDGAPPQPLHPIEGTVAPVDDARANATSPALVPRAAGITALPETLLFKGAPVDPPVLHPDMGTTRRRRRHRPHRLRNPRRRA